MNDERTGSVEDDLSAFLRALSPDDRRADAHDLVALFARATGEAPFLWDGSIIGFGRYRYRYASGREGAFVRSGFAPGKDRFSLHLMGGYADSAAGARRDALLPRLGKHKLGKSCLYIKRLADVDQDVLEEIVRDSHAAMNRLYPG